MNDFSAVSALVVAVVVFVVTAALLVLLPSHFDGLLPVVAAAWTAVIGFFFGHQVGAAK